ncbi:polysaccharide deacetylase family protein [Actinomadura macrotermitis]|uniref:NodB homology domain-containing protein n=1 Tax=Actinomadura macrotermitis TaxID=2585200 RepID=A0A7K0BRQ0_9ACTN|nr:hypothetical protein [Actinomadura macrotermitis]
MRTVYWGAVLVAAAVTAAAGCGSAPSKNARQVAVQRPSAPASPSPPPPRKINCGEAAGQVKCVALTFDDGPGDYSNRLLDMLKQQGARATFFLLGQSVELHPDAVKRMALEGHEIGNHTWSHKQLTSLPDGAVQSEIQRTQQVIKQASGVTPMLFRPPFGAVNARVNKVIGMPDIMWSVDTLDWQHQDTARDIKVGVNQPKAGDIVLFHEIHKTTIDAMPQVLAGLKQKGFTFVTVTEMYLGQGQPLLPGHSYPASWR